MVSSEVAGGDAGAKAFVEPTKLFTLAESLGGVESLIELPAQMTHLSPAVRCWRRPRTSFDSVSASKTLTISSRTSPRRWVSRGTRRRRRWLARSIRPSGRSAFAPFASTSEAISTG